MIVLSFIVTKAYIYNTKTCKLLAIKRSNSDARPGVWENPGGGLKHYETANDGIKREVMEELGLEVQSCEYVGTIIDSYNLIKRITVSSFFHCLVDSSALQETHRTEEEQILIKEIVWLTPEEALDWLDNRCEHKVDKLVQRRDAMALRYYLDNCRK